MDAELDRLEDVAEDLASIFALQQHAIKRLNLEIMDARAKLAGQRDLPLESFGRLDPETPPRHWIRILRMISEAADHRDYGAILKLTEDALARPEGPVERPLPGANPAPNAPPAPRPDDWARILREISEAYSMTQVRNLVAKALETEGGVP